jgi:hypothetical protein
MPRYALIVGVGQQYQYLSRLSKPEQDAQTVGDLLQQRGTFKMFSCCQRSRLIASIQLWKRCC